MTLSEFDLFIQQLPYFYQQQKTFADSCTEAQQSPDQSSHQQTARTIRLDDKQRTCWNDGSNKWLVKEIYIQLDGFYKEIKQNLLSMISKN